MVPRPKMLAEHHGSDNKRHDPSSDSEEEVEIYNKPGNHFQHHSSIMIAERRYFSLRRKFVHLLSRLRSVERLSPPTTLLLLVLIDMFAVSLVVPLLFQYYKSAGVNNAGQRELLSSLFSTSQIVGGLLMGLVTDARLVRRKSLLFISFAGSALSYSLIAYGGFSALVCSRVLVGLVKQTMTVTTAMLTSCTSRTTRAHYMGRLSAASTVAWIVGPSVGAMLYRYVDPRAPALLACVLFVLNILLAAKWLPTDEENDHHDKSPSQRQRITVLQKLKSCFTSQNLGSVVLARLIFTWVARATNYSQLGNFYEDMYGLEPHQRGYISSYQQFLQFLVQSTLVTAVMRWSGGERQTICFFTALLAGTLLLECFQSLPFFLTVLCPVMSLCFGMTQLSLQSLLTHVVPLHSMFSVLAALDVLQNAVSVSVPFYRTFLFRVLVSANNDGANKSSMADDPDPISWIRLSVCHWCVAAVVIAGLLLPNRLRSNEEVIKKMQ
jgi:MFS family permease